MAATLNDHRASYQPVLSTTLAADYLDFENDQANIRAGRRTQQILTHRQRWQSYLSPIPRSRSRLSSEDDLQHANERIDPHLETSFASNRLSLPVRIVRRLTNKDARESYGPSTVPSHTKRQQRKIEKQQKRLWEKIEKHRQDNVQDQLDKHNLDLVTRQLEANERERRARLPESLVRRSVKERVKDTIRKTTKLKRTKPLSAQLPDAPKYAPLPDCPHGKSYYESPYDANFEIPHPPTQTTLDPPEAAELPAESISSWYDSKSDAPKHRSDDSIDLETLPPRPIRSPSPCLSSMIRRGVTLSQTPQALSSKQMKCDYCHDAIKLAGYHYACTVCDDGDRLYCAKCANDGRTCRHELIERTRNIQRHPTNPQPSTHYHERKILSLEKDPVICTDAHVELSASSPSPEPNVAGSQSCQLSDPTTPVKAQNLTSPSPVSSTSPTEVFKELEAKRREQEVVFREKEVTLREREASLRVREAWTASRERDAAFVQQLQAAAMFQRERATEVGAQFLQTPSRRPSHISHRTHVQTSRPERARTYPSHSNLRNPSCNFSSPHTAGSSSASQNQPAKLNNKSVPPSHKSCSIHDHQQAPSFGTQTDGIRLHSSERGKRPNIELVSAVAALEASVAGIETVDPIVRSYAGSSKRKASGPESKPPNKDSIRKSQGSARRTPQDKRDRRLDRDDQESEDSEEGSPKRQKQTVNDQPDKKLFACPYFKFEPTRYAEGNTHELHYRGCAGGLYRDISRVKQHLKRVHHRPDYYCRRCFAVFDANDDLQEHSHLAQGCTAGTCPFPEKLDETQQNKIHIKRPGKDPKDLWYDIFKIIFPGAPVPDSPYIEAAQPKSDEHGILENFIRLFEAKLDTSTSSHPWLSSASARDFLRIQLKQAAQETILDASSRSPRDLPVLVSPLSPSVNSQFPASRQGSHSSRRSSSFRSADQIPSRSANVASGPVMSPNYLVSLDENDMQTCSRHRPLLSPVSPVTSLRPALKVRTQTASSSSGSPLFSAKSQNSCQFPMLPPHVQDDLEREQDTANSSWRSGDDVHAMTGTMQEPTSATSTRSGKSVTFATPPPFVASWRETNEAAPSWHRNYQQNMVAPDLAYFTNFDWSAETFAANDCYQQSAFGKQRPHPPDSAYGTLSSQASRSSMLPVQFVDSEPYQHCQSTCIDPQVLFVNPVSVHTHIPGISPDLQAYLNRNGQACLGQHRNTYDPSTCDQ